MNTALIAMSGGVDSSVAAYVMQQRGFTCSGAIMRLHRAKEEVSCCTSQDIEDARNVANTLGMDFYVFDFQKDFQRCVVDRFVRAYENGTTPNPCVDCNRNLKFLQLYEMAEKMGMEYVVTGHYARVCYENGRYLLKKGRTPEKDQSYVLYALTQHQLAHTIFPLGEYDKEQVRQIAEKQHLVNARKKDSQDICFIPDGDYAGFIRRYTGKDYPQGDFVDVNGNKMGRHQGLICYTVGQRRGLGVAAGKPIYVKELIPEKNQVVLAENHQLFSATAIAENFNWISMDAPTEPIRANARARYHHPEQPATVTVLPDGRVEVVFDTPQRALTKGQAIVLYHGDVVVGGGTICQVKE